MFFQEYGSRESNSDCISYKYYFDAFNVENFIIKSIKEYINLEIKLNINYYFCYY